ncbi:hypothetical protein ACA910_005430 [Epithemia clementina (nom. ined.)]
MTTTDTKQQPRRPGICCITDQGDNVNGAIPMVITDRPSELQGDIDICLLALPSFAHEQYLAALKDRLQHGVILGAMPGQGAFDLCARHVLGHEFCAASHLFATETLPWACRIVDYGQTVQVLGTKKEIDVVIVPAAVDSTRTQPDIMYGEMAGDDSMIEKQSHDSAVNVLKILQQMVGPLPKLHPVDNFLAVTLMSINSIGHPAISYAFYCHKDITIPFDEPPLFYQGANEYTGQVLSQLSDEVLEIGRVLKLRYPALDLSSLHHVRDWFLRSYGPDIGDKTNIYTMLMTNKGFCGLTHPMIPCVVPNEDDDAADAVCEAEGETKSTSIKYLPNFQSRYFIEDVPCGLVVTRGIAELAGVPTPFMDKVLIWCQECMGKEYLIPETGKLQGKDIMETRCPQRYGFNNLDDFMTQNRYYSNFHHKDAASDDIPPFSSPSASSCISLATSYSLCFPVGKMVH